MKVLLALSDSKSGELIEYINSISTVEVCEVFDELKSIERKVKEHLPKVLIISHSIFNESEIDELKEVIQRLTSREHHDFRIIYLYGKDDENRVKFIDFLIRCGVYDYFFGARLTEDIINELLFNPKLDRRLVKHDILPDTVIDLKSINLTDKSDPKLIQQIISELSEEQKKQLGLFNEREIEVKVDKIVGTVVIAVVGAMPRIGTTHISLSIAKYLTSLKQKVAVLELHDSPSFMDIKEAFEGLESDFNKFVLENIVFYPYSPGLNVLDILQEDFNYIVLDMGTYAKCNKTEFKRANERIVVSGSKEWEVKYLEDMLRTCDRIDKNKYLFNFSDNFLFNLAKKNMEKLPCFMAAYNPQMTIINSDAEIVFRNMLGDVIPGMYKEKPKKSLTEFSGGIVRNGIDIFQRVIEGVRK